MLKEERQNKIIKLLSKDHKVISSDLKELFNVSEDTIRRDLSELEDQGKLKRVHKGALRIGPAITDFEYRTNIDIEEKQDLALKALPFLREDTLILVDGGTTNHRLISNLPIDFRCDIVTNSFPIAHALNGHKNIKVRVLGGNYDKRTMNNFGYQTIRELEYFKPDLYVMGVHNINIEDGATINTYEESEVKRKMSEISDSILCMVLESKLETLSSFKHTDLDKIQYLITSSKNKELINNYCRYIDTVIN